MKIKKKSETELEIIEEIPKTYTIQKLRDILKSREDERRRTQEHLKMCDDEIAKLKDYISRAEKLGLKE